MTPDLPEFGFEVAPTHDRANLPAYGVFVLDDDGQYEQICLTYCRNWADRIAAALGKDIPGQDQGETN